MGVTSWLVDCCGVCLIHSIYCLSVELYQINSLVDSLSLTAFKVIVIIIIIIIVVIASLHHGTGV